MLKYKKKKKKVFKGKNFSKIIKNKKKKKIFLKKNDLL